MCCWAQRIYASQIYLYNYNQVTNELAAWNTALDKLEKKFPHFMAIEIPLPCSQEPTIYTYLEPDKSSPQPGIFFCLRFKIIIKSARRPFKRPLSFRYSTKSCMYSFSLLCVLGAPHISYYLIRLTLGNSYLVVR